MGRTTVLLCVLSMVLVGVIGHRRFSRNPNQESLQSIKNYSFNFTNVLYTALSRHDGNIIFSPLSIHSILTMTSLGAKGTTAEEMNRVLNLDNPSVTTIGYREVYKHLKSAQNENVMLKLANKVYVNKGINLNDEFLRQSREVFESAAESVDFSRDASRTINKWVAENTNYKIKDIVPQGSLDAQSALVLVNAVYFKGKWLTEFDPADTVTRQFYVSDKKSVPVPMMHVASTFRYKEDETVKVLELPYYGDKVSMMIILPHARTGIKDLELELTRQSLKKYIKNLRDAEVDVWLPKFRLEQSTELEQQLKKMGMTTMFTDNADFSGMVGKGMRAKVSDVVHKAFIEVNEEGTEAAGATMVGIQMLSLASNDQPVLFQADHPFIFLMYHKESKQALFMGRYSVPQ